MSATMHPRSHAETPVVIMHRGSSSGLGELISLVGTAAEHPQVLVVTSAATPKRAWFQTLSDIWVSSPTRQLRLSEGCTVQALEQLLAATGDESPEVVVAIGGGSVLDAGKILSALIGRGNAIRDVLDRELDGDGLPLIAVPTVAGSGAEVTNTATLWDLEARRKHSISGQALQPNFVVVDADLATSAPLSVSVAPLLDALVQGVEAAWSPRAGSETRSLALEAVGLAARTIPQLIARPCDPLVRESAASVSVAAGRAITQTRTGLCHALSYPLTIEDGIAHGHACAMVLPAVFAYNSAVGAGNCRHPSGPRATRGILRTLCAQFGGPSVSETITELLDASGLTTLDACTSLSAPALVDDAMSYGRCRNNPRAIDRDALAAALEQELAGI